MPVARVAWWRSADPGLLPTLTACLIGCAGGLAMKPAHAAEASIVISAPRVMASLPGTTMTVAYLTVRNAGAQADRLVGATTPAAAVVELHSGQLQGGTSSMRPVQGFDLAPGASLLLANGGNHLMLMGLSRPLQAGTSIPMTLKFLRAGEVKVQIPVLAVTGR